MVVGACYLGFVMILEFALSWRAADWSSGGGAVDGRVRTRVTGMGGDLGSSGLWRESICSLGLGQDGKEAMPSNGARFLSNTVTLHFLLLRRTGSLIKVKKVRFTTGQ